MVAIFLDVLFASDLDHLGLQALTAAVSSSLASTVLVTDTTRLGQAETDVDELAGDRCSQDACIPLYDDALLENMSS